MTIDEAIWLADIGKGERDLKWSSKRLRTEFYMLCSTALRLAKYMNGASGLAKETEKIMKKKDEIEIEKACESLAEMVVNALFPEENALHSKKKQVPACVGVPYTWQERMQREYRETKERYEKLQKMITKYEAGVLEFTPKCSIELLKHQKRHMGEYLHDLEIRGYVEGWNCERSK